jgi:hypothetical protein
LGKQASQRKSETANRFCPAWLRLSADRTSYEVLDKRAAIVKRIFEEAAAGIGSYSITRRLNEQKVQPIARSKGWQTSYVSKILTGRAAIGEFQPHKLVSGKRVPDGPTIANYFPAVISEKVFFRAQQGRRERLLKTAGRKGRFFSNLFSGLAKCAYFST